MKTVIKSTIVSAALALLSTGAFASNASHVKRDTVIRGGEISAALSYNSNACEVDINIVHATAGNSVITVYDADGNVVLKDKFAIDADTISKTYLMTDLEAGDYTIEVSSNNKVVKQSIALSDDNEEQYYSL